MRRREERKPGWKRGDKDTRGKGREETRTRKRSSGWWKEREGAERKKERRNENEKGRLQLAQMGWREGEDGRGRLAQNPQGLLGRKQPISLSLINSSRDDCNTAGGLLWKKEKKRWREGEEERLRWRERDRNEWEGGRWEKYWKGGKTRVRNRKTGRRFVPQVKLHSFICHVTSTSVRHFHCFFYPNDHFS